MTAQRDAGALLLPGVGHLDRPGPTEDGAPACIGGAIALRPVRPALEDTGRLDDVPVLLAQVLGRGTGAARQRAALQRQGNIRDVLALLADRTVAE